MAKYSKMEIEKYMNRKSEIIFKFLDSDRDGIYSKRDVMTFPNELRRAGKVVLADKLTALYQRFYNEVGHFNGKPPGSTGLNKEEFVKGFAALRETDWLVQEYLPQMTDVYYESIDRNSDGVVDIGEWRAYYKSRGVNDESFVQRTFDKMDANGDGLISREEFKQSYVSFATSDDPDNDYSFIYDIKHPIVD